VRGRLKDIILLDLVMEEGVMSPRTEVASMEETEDRFSPVDF
jgi:hypothetical protein